jgi:hypothetical protein
MSVFKVNLNNMSQGQLDLNPSTAAPMSGGNYGLLGIEMSPSIQRTFYVAGPNRTYRKLKDGEQFTDCNYWKRFAYPQVAMDQAFIEIMSDDGSMYSDTSEENTYPKVYNLTVANVSTYANNIVDILGDTGSYAVFVQIANQGSTSVKVKLNGVTDAIIDLGSSEIQVFNHGDLSITKLEFANTVSGGSDTDVQVLVSVKSSCNS